MTIPIVSSSLGDIPQVVFEALADPTRRRLIERLVNGGPISITDLAAEFPITRQAISKHVVALEDAGLVHSERHGRERRLTITPAPLNAAARWIAGIEAEWDTRLASLKRSLTEESESD